MTDSDVYEWSKPGMGLPLAIQCAAMDFMPKLPRIKDAVPFEDAVSFEIASKEYGLTVALMPEGRSALRVRYNSREEEHVTDVRYTADGRPFIRIFPKSNKDEGNLQVDVMLVDAASSYYHEQSDLKQVIIDMSVRPAFQPA